MLKIFTKAVVLAAVAGGLNLAVVAPAQAQPSEPAVGRRCSFSSVTDPTIENGETQTGQINGGPLAATTPGATISMECTIQVGAANSTHAGADSCAVSSAASLQVTAVPPTLCSYLSPEGQPVYMCTKIVVGGVTFFWEATVDPVTGQASGRWTTDPNAKCTEAIRQEIFPGPLRPVLEAADEVICDIIERFWDGAPDLDRYPVRVGPTHGDDARPTRSDGSPGYNDVYVDTNGDGTITEDEMFWDCPPYLP